MSGGGKTKETTQQTTNQSVQLPAWMTQAGQSNYNAAKSYSDANPVQGYTAPMTADMSANQTAGSALARTSQGTGQSDMNAARALTGAAAGGSVPNIDAGTFGSAQAAQYMNPYIQSVQQNTMDQMRRQNTIDSQATMDSLQGAGAFGGTRQSVLQAEQGKAQNSNMMDYLAQSNADAYGNAQSQFNTDRSARVGAETTNNANQQATLDRMLAAGGQAQSIGNSAAALNSQDITNLERTGAVDQATQGDQRAAAYQEFLRMQNAPMDRYAQLGSVLSGTPHDVTTTGTSNGTSTTQKQGSLLDTLLGVGQLGVSAFSAGMFSDPRLKHDVHLIDRAPDGLGIYRFRYNWDEADERPRIGVMADEVEALQPWAMGPEIGGYRTVNYGKLQGVLA